MSSSARSEALRRNRAVGATGLALVLGAGACGPSSAQSPGNVVVLPILVDAGANASADGGGAPGQDAAVSALRGAPTACGTPQDGEGCPCAAGGTPRSCYVGAAAQAGVGLCVMGTQACLSHSEGGGVWAACTGSGAPTTCAAAGASCGAVPDGCGDLLACGTCGTGESCGATAKNMCGVGACVPAVTCASLGFTCGSAVDNCGNPLDCGSCPSGNTCGGHGAPNQCGCTPTTCDELGFACGSASDNCGGQLDCGTCATGETCGGGGTLNQCAVTLPPGCTQSSTFIYLIDPSGILYTFYPPTLAVQTLGPLACPGGPPVAETMAIDRAGMVWVLDQSADLFEANPSTLSCTATAFQPNSLAAFFQEGYASNDLADTGLSFVSNSAGSAAETLFIGCGAANELERINQPSLTLTDIGSFPASEVGTGCELKGTGDAQLFGMFTTSPVTLAQIDPATGNFLSSATVGAVTDEGDYTFSPWGGLFYFFTETSTGSGSTVTSYDATSGLATTLIQNMGISVIGSAVSTCAPTR